MGLGEEFEVAEGDARLPQTIPNEAIHTAASELAAEEALVQAVPSPGEPIGVQTV